MRTDSVIRAVALAVLLVASAPVAWAQEAPPVNVRFAFQASSVTGLFPSEAARTAAEQALSAKLAAFLGERMSYWPARAGIATEYPQLSLWLEPDGSQWFAHVALVSAAGQPATYEDRIVLYGPGELARRGGFPPLDRLPGEIEERVKAFYGTGSSRDTLVTRLGEFAPLGPGVQFAPTTHIAILPLKWDRYCSLASSVFALEYQQAGGGRVVLLAQGSGSPAPFTPDSPQFQGLMATFTTDGTPAAAPPDPQGLTPRFFRLKRLAPDPAACIDLGGMAPAVAR